MTQDTATGNVYAVDQDIDLDNAFVVKLDATVTAACVIESLAEHHLVLKGQSNRAADCVSLQHFGFVSVIVASYSTLSL